ncbi:hypothetical protein [Glutamicibacter sp. 2E12]|uniref:hypothetical protein n=1 Tax=Glutamicibacter sp. 2E12 TaxID=3416181 RepID=UPI003CFA8ABF
MKFSALQSMHVASGICALVAPRMTRNPGENGGFVELLQYQPSQADWQAVQETGHLCPSGTIQLDKHRIPTALKADRAENAAGSEPTDWP